MLGAVELLWIILTLVVSCTSLYALVQPNWIIQPFTSECFGPLTFCYLHDTYSSFSFQQRFCRFHDIHYIYIEYPSLAWQFVAVTYSLATGLILASAIAIIFGVLLLQEDIRHKMASAASYTQGMAMFLSLVSLVTFPMLLGDNRAKDICSEDASAYYFSNCQIGWSYMLAVASTSIGAFCPYLAQHTDVLLKGIDNVEHGPIRTVVDVQHLHVEGPVIYPSDSKIDINNKLSFKV